LKAYYSDTDGDRIIDLVGKKLDEWKSSGLHPGMNNRSWDLSEWPSGIYFVQLKIGNSSSMKKIVICK
jgi:hypothetical protein